MKYRILFLGLSLLLYGIALALPCLLFNIVPIDPAKVNVLRVYEMKGIELTIAGIVGLLFLQIAAIGWLANPIYWLGCIFFVRQQYKFSVIAGLTSVVIGFGGTLLAFWFALPADSGGISKLVLNKPLFGFWIWLAAPGLLALISVFRLLKTQEMSATRSE
jgi:hypothetical protein